MLLPEHTAARLTHHAQGAQILQANWQDLSAAFYLSPFYSTAPHKLELEGSERQRPILYKSEASGNALTPSKITVSPVRGGVPILFPQFAETGPLPKHGMVRSADWHLREELIEAAQHRVRYELNINATDYDFWPHAAKLSLTVCARANVIAFTLAVLNTGLDAYTWTGGLHPYFALNDLLTSRLSGLAGLAVEDRYNRQISHQSESDLIWTSAPCERLYAQCPELILNTGELQLTLSASGFDQWMVWNPGELGSQALPDLAPGDWRRFVCVEPVRVTRPVLLMPGESFSGELRIACNQSNSSFALSRDA